MIASPACASVRSISSSRSTKPMQKPARSNASAAITPGMLGRLAADERAADRVARLRDAAPRAPRRAAGSTCPRPRSRGRRPAGRRGRRRRRRTSRRGPGRSCRACPAARAISVLVPTPSVGRHEDGLASCPAGSASAIRSRRCRRGGPLGDLQLAAQQLDGALAGLDVDAGLLRRPRGGSSDDLPAARARAGTCGCPTSYGTGTG